MVINNYNYLFSFLGMTKKIFEIRLPSHQCPFHCIMGHIGQDNKCNMVCNTASQL